MIGVLNVGQFFLPCDVVCVCYYFSDLVCENVSEKFVYKIFCFLIFSSHFVPVFNFVKEEWISDRSLLYRGFLCCNFVRFLYVLRQSFNFRIYLFCFLGVGVNFVAEFAVHCPVCVFWFLCLSGYSVRLNC